MNRVKRNKTEQSKFSTFHFQFSIILLFVVAFSITTMGCKEKKKEEEEKVEEIAKGTLTINNLPERPEQVYNVEIYQSGTTITISNWGRPETNSLGVANGTVLSSNNVDVFYLWEWDKIEPRNKWYGTGNFPVVLVKVHEWGLAISKITEVKFTDGGAVIDFNAM